MLRPRRFATILAAYVLFSFLLHFVWEMLQSPLYDSLRNLPHAEAVQVCALATLGDVGIALVAYVGAALVQRAHLWILDPRIATWVIYLIIGLAITVLFEYLATGTLQRWTYSDQMSRLPVLGTGVSPLLQWLVVPSIVLWLTRQHAGSR